MPMIKPASRNDETNLVVIDVDAFDECMDLQRRILEREMAALRSIMEAHDDAQAGRLTSFADIRRD